MQKGTGKLLYNYFSNKRLFNSRSFRASLNSQNFSAHFPHLTRILKSNFSSLNINTDEPIAKCTQVPPQREPSSLELSRFSHPQQRTFKNKFGLPPTPAIEGREEPRVSFPSILYNTYKQKNDSIDEQTINKFGMHAMPSDEKYVSSRIASLLTQSSGLRATGSFLRGFRH